MHFLVHASKYDATFQKSTQLISNGDVPLFPTPSTDDRLGIFRLFGNVIANDTNVHLILNPEPPPQKQPSTRIISAPAKRI